jgi:hypothetical protein
MPAQCDMYGEIHWACSDCLVRPACTQRCERTNYKHQLCEPCEKDCCSKYPCKEVLTAKMYETIWENYGDQMLKYYAESSLFSRLMK